MSFSTFETNVDFVNKYLMGSHLTAFTGYNLYARKSGIYVKVTARNRNDSCIIKTVGINLDWKIMSIASKPWLKAQLDRIIKEASTAKAKKTEKKAA